MAKKTYTPPDRSVKVFKKHFAAFKKHQIVIEYHEEDLDIDERFALIINSQKDRQIDTKEAILAAASLYIAKK